MAVHTKPRPDTFTALRECFAADLAALIGDPSPHGATPTRFIYLVEEVRDVLATSSCSRWQDAGEDLDAAAGYLTDALTSPHSDQHALLARARTYLRDGIAKAT
ncbi:hypothetical protein [Streptomyces sp. NRRL F-2890]|uniref:hypothetical protein n=1 Tax=Streptomyces sp. NRRL F-2890 TaxID=1463845 RepID=UPI0004CAD56B|nr:hypothetical protein [Streptomyces sp. NRRL F-2890]